MPLLLKVFIWLAATLPMTLLLDGAPVMELDPFSAGALTPLPTPPPASALPFIDEDEDPSVGGGGEPDTLLCPSLMSIFSEGLSPSLVVELGLSLSFCALLDSRLIAH